MSVCLLFSLILERNQRKHVWLPIPFRAYSDPFELQDRKHV
jgi:hypothetical protein